jgi:hypothetical protein
MLQDLASHQALCRHMRGKPSTIEGRCFVAPSDSTACYMIYIATRSKDDPWEYSSVCCRYSQGIRNGSAFSIKEVQGMAGSSEVVDFLNVMGVYKVTRTHLSIAHNIIRFILLISRHNSIRIAATPPGANFYRKFPSLSHCPCSESMPRRPLVPQRHDRQ